MSGRVYTGHAAGPDVPPRHDVRECPRPGCYCAACRAERIHRDGGVAMPGCIGMFCVSTRHGHVEGVTDRPQVKMGEKKQAWLARLVGGAFKAIGEKW